MGAGSFDPRPSHLNPPQAAADSSREPAWDLVAQRRAINYLAAGKRVWPRWTIAQAA